ncbi:hypothetical protein FJZ53_06700, partial [Candidatus Woesearchaeota archaeon]|nr:hypothetical protein [Candidatus Woesearchaeota archaeon]
MVMKLDFVKSVILVSALMLIAVLPILAQDSESAYGQHIIKPNYELSRSYVDRKLAPETFFEDVLTVSNLKSEQISLSLSISGDVAPIISLASNTVTVDAKNETSIRFKIFGKKIGSYNGTIAITGGFEEHIPVSVIVTEEDLTSDFFLEIIPSKTKFNKNSGLEFKVDIHKLISGEYNITMDYALTSLYDN